MSRAAGLALGVRRSAFKWIVSECSLTRLGPSQVLSSKHWATRQELFPRTPFRANFRVADLTGTWRISNIYPKMSRRIYGRTHSPFTVGIVYTTTV